MTPCRYLPVALCALLSTHSMAKDLIDLKTFPEWFTEGMAREASIKTSSAIKIAELAVDGEVSGKASLAEQGEGYWYYVIDIGTGSPVECYSFTSFDGPANSLYSVVDVGVSGVQELNQKKLSGRYNLAIDTGMVNHTPYLALDTLYTLDGENSEKVTGVIKAASAETQNSLQICMHNEIGYRDTFSKVFESFVSVFQKTPSENTFFEPVFKLSFGGIPIGYGYESHSVDADGDIQTRTKTAMLTPVDASNVARTDGVDISWSTRQGNLINAHTQSIENSTLASQFSLERNEGKWQVEGQMQGKAISETLQFEGELLSDYGSYVASVNLLTSEQQSGVFNMWVAEADPVSSTPVTLRAIKGQSEANLEIDMGPFVLKFLSDEKGILRKGTMEQGPVSINIDLMAVKGEPLQL